MSETMKRKITAAQAKVLNDLTSKDERRVFAALEKTEQEGNEYSVLPVLELFRDSKSEEVRKRCREMLEALKVSAAEEILTNALDDQNFNSIKGDIMSFMWNSGMQPTDAVDLITKTTLEGDFMTAVEGMTLLDSLNAVPDEESLYNALVMVRDFLKTHKDDGHELYNIAISLYEMLSRFEKE